MKPELLTSLLSNHRPEIREYCIRKSRQLLEESDAEKWLRANGFELKGSAYRGDPKFVSLAGTANAPKSELSSDGFRRHCLHADGSMVEIVVYTFSGEADAVEWAAMIPITEKTSSHPVQYWMTLPDGDIQDDPL